jgi:hypothetical protein
VTTAIAGGIISLEYAAEGVRYASATVGSAANATRDADLTAYVQAATPVIEDIIGPVIQVTKTVAFNGGSMSIMLNDAVSSITSVTENGVLLTSGQYFLDTQANILIGGSTTYSRIFTPSMLGVVVTYVAGFAVVPANVQMATRELVRFMIQQGKNAQRPGFGDPVEATVATPMGFLVPKRVMEWLAPNRKLGGFA